MAGQIELWSLKRFGRTPIRFDWFGSVKRSSRSGTVQPYLSLSCSVIGDPAEGIPGKALDKKLLSIEVLIQWLRLFRLGDVWQGGKFAASEPLERVTFEGLVIGSLLYSLPFAVQPFAASFGAVDKSLLRASASLGHSPVQTFRRIVLPLSKAGLVTGFALSFAHTLGEFGVVLMVGGNIPGVTRTISIDVYDQVQTANYSSANQTALLLLIISFVVLSMVYGFNRRLWAVGPWR